MPSPSAAARAGRFMWQWKTRMHDSPTVNHQRARRAASAGCRRYHALWFEYLRRPAGRERYGRLAIGSYQVQGLAMVLDKLGRGDQRPLEGDLRSEAISQPMRIEPALISGPSSLFGLTNSLFLEKCSLIQCVANLAEKFQRLQCLESYPSGFAKPLLKKIPCKFPE